MNRSRVAATAAPMLLLTTGWWFGVWNHQNDQATEFEARAAAATASAQQDRIESRAAEAFNADLDAGTTRLQALRLSLPTSPDIGGFVTDNEAAAINAGVVVSSLNPDPPDSKPKQAPVGLQATGISLTVTGGPTQVTRYLDELMAMPRAVAIDDFSASGQSSAQASLTLSIRIFNRH